MPKKATRLQDLAERAGVSVSTASRALNDSPSVNMRTKQAIWKLAREMDYPFRRSMPAGPIGAKAAISVVVPRTNGRELHLADPFTLELLAGIADAAKSRDCDINISHIAPSSFQELEVAMTAHRADGVIFIGQSALHTAFNRLADSHGRFVVWGAELPEQHYCSVGSDNVSGGKRATGHLARLGRRRIAFLGDTDLPEAMQRYRGYRAALDEANLEDDPSLVRQAHFDIESAQTAMDALLQDKVEFDAVFAATDAIALGALRTLHRAGLRVPDDVAVIGYDNITFSRYSNPALTTIDQDGAKAGRLMLSKLLDSNGRDAARPERLETDLIVRASCGG